MRSSADSALVNKMTQLHYVDSHAHIMAEEFQDDFHQMLERNKENGVDRILIITLHCDETMRAIEFACKDPERYQVACAVFPEDVKELTDAGWEQFVKTASLKEVSVLGEMGLDYYWEKDLGVRALQREIFVRQLELAKLLNKPIAVHARDAIQDTFDIMKEHHHKGVLHCYSGTKEMAREFTKLGYYIALGGPVTFKNARHAVEVVQDIDPKFLLTETDCPYMAPEPNRGKRNEPSYIPLILKKMAEVKGMSEEELSRVVYENYRRFLHE